MRTKLLATVVSLVLAGCTVGPDYVHPDTTAAVTFHNEALAQARQAPVPPPLDAWWKGFSDPELESIIARAMAQNLDLAASQARVDQARAAAKHASADRLPQGNLDASVARQRQSLRSPLGKIASAYPGYSREQTLEEAGAGASWELDLAGGLRRGAEAANDEYQAAEAAHAGVRVSLAAEAADAYFRVRGAQSRIAIAEDQIRNEQGLVDLVRLRGEGGVGTVRETAQAEALLLQAKASVPPLTIERETQLNRLDVLMGVAPGTYAAEIKAPAHDYVVPGVQTAGGPASLWRRRPDVIAAERELAASNARIGVALSAYYPSMSLSSVLGFSSLDSGKLLTGSAFQPQGLAGLHWRLFDFGRVDAEVAQARGAHAEALATYRAAMLRATEDVEDALVSLSELESQHALLTDEVASHTRARDAAQDAYTGGAISLIEVLDEDRQLLASRDLLARVHTDDARSAVAAFRALGGGWDAPALRPGVDAAAPLASR